MKHTTTTDGTTFVNVSDLPQFLKEVNEVDPGRFVVARGSLWYFCDNSAEWVKCDAYLVKHSNGLKAVQAFDVTEALNPEALTLSL